MGVIRGKQWSNNHGEMPAVSIKGCSSGDRNSSWDILVSCVTQIKLFPTLCSLILIQTSRCGVTLVWKSHVVLGQGQGVRNDFTAWNFLGSEILTGALAEMVNQFGRQIPAFFLTVHGERRKMDVSLHSSGQDNFNAHSYCSYTRNAPWSLCLIATCHMINKEFFEPPCSSSRNLPEQNCCCTSSALPTSYNTNFPAVKQIYKCFPASDKASWISLQLGFVCSWFLPVTSLSPPWHGCGDLIVCGCPDTAWGEWEREITTLPLFWAENKREARWLLLFQKSVGHTVHFQRDGSVTLNPLLLSLRGTKLRKPQNPDAPCNLTSFRLVISWEKIRVEPLSLQWQCQTLQTNPIVLQELSSSVSRRVWRDAGKVEYSPSCFLLSLANIWLNWIVIELIVIELNWIIELSWSSWSHLGWKQSIWHSIHWLLREEIFKRIFKILLYLFLVTVCL